MDYKVSSFCLGIGVYVYVALGIQRVKVHKVLAFVDSGIASNMR